jgi:fructokinase
MRFKVAGIGELLWDVSPEGRRMGGAPVNFACHCSQLGAEAYPVSCVGVDELGAGIFEALTSFNMDSSYVAEDAKHPTGTVQVALDNIGKPSYEICEGVAWDFIPFSERLKVLAQQMDAVCFGSLCQRNPVSRATIHSFLKAMRPNTLRIFDVNLRQSFYTKDIIGTSLELANILKLSDDELPVFSDMFDLSGSVQEQLLELIQKHDLKLLAYTRGAQGSLLLAPQEINDHPGCPIQVVDSVGAGDSFTAALSMGLLNIKTLAEINDHANRMAAFVCSQMGATPVLPVDLRNPWLIIEDYTERY